MVVAVVVCYYSVEVSVKLVTVVVQNAAVLLLQVFGGGGIVNSRLCGWVRVSVAGGDAVLVVFRLLVGLVLILLFFFSLLLLSLLQHGNKQ